MSLSNSSNKGHPKYAKFDIIETHYRVINSHEIQAYILILKNLASGKYSVIENFHSGFFVSQFK
jgi:hypothetical protein